MKGFNIGSLNQRIVFTAPTSTQDEVGQQVLTFSTYAERWANVTPSGGGEAFEGQEKVASIYIDVVVRADGLDLNELMRITWKGKEFNILSIDEYSLTTGNQNGFLIKGKAKDS